MGVISTVTIGSDTFSVYALTSDPVADATTYLNGLLGAGTTAWTGATTDNQKRALVMAADWIDRAIEIQLSGEKSVSGQARAWPRDGATCDGTSLADGAIPDDFANAQFWLAGQLLVDSTAASGSGQGSNVKKAKAGSAEVTFFRPTIGTSTDTRLPIVVMDYVKCYFSGFGTGGAGVATGTSTASSFCPDDVKRSEGFS